MFAEMIYNFDMINYDFMICEEECLYEKRSMTIPINNDLLDKYNNVSDIFFHENVNDYKITAISQDDVCIKNNKKKCI